MVLLVPRQEGPDLLLWLLLVVVVAERTRGPSRCLAWLLAACHQSPAAWRSWTCGHCLLPGLLSPGHHLGPRLLQLCLQGQQQWVLPGYLALWIPLQGLVSSGTLHG